MGVGALFLLGVCYAIVIPNALSIAVNRLWSMIKSGVIIARLCSRFSNKTFTVRLILKKALN
jgi:hypothetical protein